MVINKKAAPKVFRLPTGFPKLDAMLQGGIPQNTVTLLSGACGTGKSTIAMQFLYHGAKLCDEPGVYVTLEETPASLVNNMALFGWDIDELIQKKKLAVIKPEIYKFDSIKQVIADAIDRIGAKRLVVDSYSVLLTYFNDPNQIRSGLVQLDREIKKMGCTALIISDIKDNAEIFSTTGVEEFIVDGVIVLSLIKSLKHPYSSMRSISVRKMRATRHPLSHFRFDITDEGVEIGGEVTGDDMWVGRTVAIKDKKKKKTSAPQVQETQKPKKKALIDISTLKRRGSHSWKWKHL